MVSVKVSSKYQVVIPPEVRQERGIKPGDEMVWYDDGGTLALVKVMSLEESAGVLAGYDLPPFVRDKSDRPAGLGE